MKRLILFFVILLQTNFCDAQKIRFTDTSNRWVFLCENDPAPPVIITHSDQYIYTGDSLIDGQQYFRLGSAYFREDTTTSRVYFWDGQNGDVVFMDFNLAVGDTFRFGSNTSVLAGTGSVLINNVLHKTQTFLTGFSMPYHIIEGIGCTTNGLFYPFNPTAIEPICHFCSFAQGSTIMYKHLFICTLSINEVKVQTKFFISPNPITPQSKILLPYKISSGTLSIYDFTGRKIFDKEFTQKEELLIGDLNFTPGVYFFLVKDNNSSQTLIGKFAHQ